MRLLLFALPLCSQRLAICRLQVIPITGTPAYISDIVASTEHGMVQVLENWIAVRSSRVGAQPFGANHVRDAGCLISLEATVSRRA